MHEDTNDTSDAGLNGDEERRELDPAAGSVAGSVRGRHGAGADPETPNEPVSQGKPALRKPRTGGRRGNSA
jgi:hypothetical protein